MALTGKLTDIVRNTAYALTASLALANPLASPLYSCEKPAPKKEDPYSTKIQLFPDVEIKLPCYHRAEDLLSLIETKKSKKLNEKERAVIIKSLEQQPIESIARVYHCYENPEKFLDSLPEEEKKEFDEFFKDYKGIRSRLLDKITPIVGKEDAGKLLNEGEKLIRDSYSIGYPWGINLDNPNLSEKLIIYFQEKEAEQFKKNKLKNSKTFNQ